MSVLARLACFSHPCPACVCVVEEEANRLREEKDPSPGGHLTLFLFSKSFPLAFFPSAGSPLSLVLCNLLTTYRCLRSLDERALLTSAKNTERPRERKKHQKTVSSCAQATELVRKTLAISVSTRILMYHHAAGYASTGRRGRKLENEDSFSKYPGTQIAMYSCVCTYASKLADENSKDRAQNYSTVFMLVACLCGPFLRRTETRPKERVRGTICWYHKSVPAGTVLGVVPVTRETAGVAELVCKA